MGHRAMGMGTRGQGDKGTRGQGGKVELLIFIAHCPMPDARCPLPDAHCPLPIAHRHNKKSTIIILSF
ncbi:hypothetical protein [Tolypothrix sp. VBCCA 56010]|uniref:hypothetical protein n=1 Tax=Tolypothrix sp. VBCCA 56010 TaxID=3137731 RepID=UPI003D7C5E48